MSKVIPVGSIAIWISRGIMEPDDDDEARSYFPDCLCPPRTILGEDHKASLNSIEVFRRRISCGANLHSVRTKRSQKGGKLIHFADLAKYLDHVAEQACKELAKIN
jgi:hypothetical protein